MSFIFLFVCLCFFWALDLFVSLFIFMILLFVSGFLQYCFSVAGHLLPHWEDEIQKSFHGLMSEEMTGCWQESLNEGKWLVPSLLACGTQTITFFSTLRESAWFLCPRVLPKHLFSTSSQETWWAERKAGSGLWDAKWTFLVLCIHLDKVWLTPINDDLFQSIKMNRKDLSYEKRLRKLDLFSPEKRRPWGDLIEAFLYLTGSYKQERDQLFHSQIVTGQGGMISK